MMTCKLQYLAIVSSIVLCLFAYLYHVPNNQNVSQMSKIRLLSASMKIIKFICFVCESFDLAPAWRIHRSIGVLFSRKQVDWSSANLKIIDKTIENVPVRIYSPISSKLNGEKPIPAIIYYHGGAFFRGSIDTHNSITRELADQTGFVVISVEYRLAPEHPFPAGLNDCTIVANYFLNTSNSDNFGVDSTRIAIVGDSAGGNLAAVVAMRFATNNSTTHVPRTQVLIYPVVQFFDLMLPSYMENMMDIFDTVKDSGFLGLYLNKSISKDIFMNRHTTVQQKKRLRAFVDRSFIPNQFREIHKEPVTDDAAGNPNLIENAKQALDTDVSPLLVDNVKLAKLSRTYILTVGHDRLRDEGFIYAGRLKANRVNVVHRHFQYTFHGSLTFLEGIFKLDIAHEMLQDIVKYLKENL